MEYGKQLLCSCDDDKSFFGKVGAPSSGHYMFSFISPCGFGLLAIIVVVVTVEFKILWTLEQTACGSCHFTQFSFGSIEV